MINSEIGILAFSALSIGFLHTLFGPDHYIPFIAMAKAGKWSKKKTLWVTTLSGFGHVVGSVILGLLGVALGIALNIVEEIEAYRGTIAGWSLISFGFIYFLWALRKLIRNRSHTHEHTHVDGSKHSHIHSHTHDHSHIHKDESTKITPWILFVIFVLGPCEALIPLLIYPAANISISGIIIVILLFAISTVATMVGIVSISLYGFSFVSFQKFEKYTHVSAGLIILLSGLGIQVLGL